MFGEWLIFINLGIEVNRPGVQMEWSGDKTLEKIPPKLVEVVSDFVKTSDNLLIDLDRTFSIDTKYAPNLLIVMPGQAMVIREGEMEDDLPVLSQDFVPIIGMSRYKMERCEGELDMSLSPIGSDEIHSEFNFKFDWMISNPSNLLSSIIERFPSLDLWLDDKTPNPVMCAVSISGSYCDILGVYQIDNGTLSGDGDIESLAESVSLVTSSVHETAAILSKFRVTVHTSIFDRVANEEISVPASFLRKEGGGLEHPMYVKLSKKVCKEMDIIQDVEFCIFRDSSNLFITISAPKRAASMIRMKFSDLINAKGRINGSRIRSALSKSMALNREKSGVSKSAFNRRKNPDDSEPLGTRVGVGLKLAMMNTHYLKSAKGTLVEVRTNNSTGKMFYVIAPVLLHLCLARFDPSLRGEIRVRKGSKGRSQTRNGLRRQSRLFDWGTDTIRYISEDRGGQRGRHWVNAHWRKVEIKSPTTIRYYETNDFPIIRNGGKVIGFRVIRGHYRGSGLIEEWDGKYNFGKRPSYYSNKAIRWLKSIEREQGISIQHAEQGGELRIPTKDSFIQVDGWCIETNTVYEFHGDVYHGNPSIFAEGDFCHPFDRTLTAGELLERTREKELAITSRGFNLVTMWEREWDSIEEIMTKTSN